jgi:PAS domain S-box-containing protein
VAREAQDRVVSADDLTAAVVDRPASGDATLPHAFLDRAPAMYLADRNGRIVYSNAAFDALAPAIAAAEGIDALELRTVFQRLDTAHPELIVRHTATVAGQMRHVRAHHFLVTQGGSVTGFGGTLIDVTGEAAALETSAALEARYHDVIRSTSDWVWEADANLNLTYVSERITEALEMLPRALVGRNLLLLGTFDEAPAARPMRERLLRDFLPFRGQTFLMPNAHGETRRIQLAGVPVFEPATGAFAGYRGTGTDVTVRHRAEEGMRDYQRQLQDSLAQLQERNVQLDEALAQAQEAARAKTDFLGKMSHELRTPLNAVIGFSEIAAQQAFGPLNDHYLSYFRDIRNAAYHLLTIINDILDAVSLEARSVHLSIEPLALADVVAEAKSLVSVRAQQDGIDLSAVAADPRWRVMADAGRLRQILVNLLNNAVKFTDRGGRIGIELRDAPNDVVAITVWDTGHGIPADQHERIFESFHQVGSDLMTAPREGTGLGLSVSRQLAHLMGGDIAVASAPGQGSRFTVTLPKAA